MPHVEFTGSDGKVWPSATELTGLLPKDWVWAWYERSVKKAGYAGWQANKAKSDEGKRLGTEVHNILDSFINKLPRPEASNQGDKLADSLWKAVNPTIDEWVKGDTHVVSNRLKMHGAFDGLVRKRYQTGLVIGDWKTNYSIDPSHPLQLAVYALCWNESNPGQLVDVGEIWRIDKDSKGLNVKIDEYKGLSKYFPLVKALRDIWGYLNDKEGK